MQFTMRLTLSLKPCVDRLIVPLARVVCFGLEFERIEVLYLTFSPSCSNALLTSFSSGEYLNMDHIMLLTSSFLIEIDATIENKISWLHLLLL